MICGFAGCVVANPSSEGCVERMAEQGDVALSPVIVHPVGDAFPVTDS